MKKRDIFYVSSPPKLENLSKQYGHCNNHVLFNMFQNPRGIRKKSHLNPLELLEAFSEGPVKIFKGDAKIYCTWYSYVTKVKRGQISASCTVNDPLVVLRELFSSKGCMYLQPDAIFGFRAVRNLKYRNFNSLRVPETGFLTPFQ